MMSNMNIIATHISNISIFFEIHMCKKLLKNIKICILTKKRNCKKYLKIRSFCISVAKKLTFIQN